MKGVRKRVMDEKLGVLLIGHGSRNPKATQLEVIREIARTMEKRGLYKIVKAAFNEFNSPTIEEGLREIAREGVTTIVALPTLLAHGTHTREDIPEKLQTAFEGEWAELGKGVKILYGEPIGVDERIVDILVDRAKEALVQK